MLPVATRMTFAVSRSSAPRPAHQHRVRIHDAALPLVDVRPVGREVLGHADLLLLGHGALAEEQLADPGPVPRASSPRRTARAGGSRRGTARSPGASWMGSVPVLAPAPPRFDCRSTTATFLLEVPRLGRTLLPGGPGADHHQVVVGHPSSLQQGRPSGTVRQEGSNRRPGGGMGAAMALPPLTEALQPLLESLDEALHQRERERRAGPAGRRPVQVLYGGAHLFKAGRGGPDWARWPAPRSTPTPRTVRPSPTRSGCR